MAFKKLHWDFLLALFVILLVGGYGIFAFQKDIKESEHKIQGEQELQQIKDVQVGKSLVEINDWNTYTSADLGFSIQYPAQISVQELEKPVTGEKYVGFSFSGPTQVDGTEPYDAITLYFENIITNDIKQEAEKHVHLAVACVAVANECGGIIKEEVHEIEVASQKGYTAVVSGGGSIIPFE